MVPPPGGTKFDVASAAGPGRDPARDGDIALTGRGGRGGRFGSAALRAGRFDVNHL
jgi:hypothetical protein